MKIILNDDEKETASQICQRMKNDTYDAYTQLVAAPENIRDAILLALVYAVDNLVAPDNPFE